MKTKVTPGHDDIILTMSLHGDYLVTGSKDNTVKLWKVSKNQLSLMATYKGHSKHVTTLHIAPKKSKFFVSGSKDLTIKIWKLMETIAGEAKEVVEAARTTAGHSKDINVVRVSPNDKIIASGSQDRNIKVQPLPL